MKESVEPSPRRATVRKVAVRYLKKYAVVLAAISVVATILWPGWGYWGYGTRPRPPLQEQLWYPALRIVVREGTASFWAIGLLWWSFLALPISAVWGVIARLLGARKPPPAVEDNGPGNAVGDGLTNAEESAFRNAGTDPHELDRLVEVDWMEDVLDSRVPRMRKTSSTIVRSASSARHVHALSSPIRWTPGDRRTSSDWAFHIANEG